MMKKQTSDRGRCVNASVFQEYIAAARSVGVASFSPYRCPPSGHNPHHPFQFNSETELEEVLTFYTQKNKSSTIFLGTKVRSVKELCEVNVSGNCESSKSESLLCFIFHQIPVTLALVYVLYFIIQVQ